MEMGLFETLRHCLNRRQEPQMPIESPIATAPLCPHLTLLDGLQFSRPTVPGSWPPTEQDWKSEQLDSLSKLSKRSLTREQVLIVTRDLLASLESEKTEGTNAKEIAFAFRMHLHGITGDDIACLRPDCSPAHWWLRHHQAIVKWQVMADSLYGVPTDTPGI